MISVSEKARAVIEWRSMDGTPSAAIRRAFEKAGYHLVVGPAPVRFTRRPDLVIIDIRRVSNPARAGRDLLQAVQASGAPAGVIFFITPGQHDIVNQTWPRRSVYDTSQPLSGLIALIDTRLRIGRLAEAAACQLEAIVATDAVPPSPNLPAWPAIAAWPAMAENARARILIAGPPAATAFSLLNTLRQRGLTVSTALSVPQIVSALDHLSYDAIVIQPRTHDDLLVMLARSLKRQARYKSLPIFLIDDELDEARPERASHPLITLTVGDATGRAADQISRAADLNRRHEALRQLVRGMDAHIFSETRLSEKLPAETNRADPRAPLRDEARPLGLVAEPDGAGMVFLAHVETLIKRRVATKTPLGAIAIRIAETTRNAEIGAQKSRLAGHVLRASFRLQDLVVQIDREIFMAICPHACSDDLARMTERARKAGASVLRDGRSHASFVQLESHEKAPELIARAIRSVREIAVRESA